MSCGLGAVVLVFMIVKQHVDTSALEADLLTSDIEALDAREAEAQPELERLSAELATLSAGIDEASKSASQAEEEKRKAYNRLRESKRNLTKLETEVKNIEPQKADDVVETKTGGEENYVIGLRVEGRKIAILLDASSSMTDEDLIEIIRRKGAGDAKKRAGPKWQRSVEIVRWLMARLPAGSEVALIAFGDKARLVGSPSWVASRDANGLQRVLSDLKTVTPEGPTNLQAGLEAARKLAPSNVYLITDGLPTTGNSRYVSLNPFASCNSLLGKSNTISGDCRKKLFYQSISDSALGGAVTVNVILLPIEGDPEASGAYWGWASATGGLMMAPAETWP